MSRQTLSCKALKGIQASLDIIVLIIFFLLSATVVFAAHSLYVMAVFDLVLRVGYVVVLFALLVNTRNLKRVVGAQITKKEALPVDKPVVKRVG